MHKHDLYATGTTGRLIEEVTNLSIHKYLTGHLGGVQQLGSQIAHNQIDVMIFYVILYLVKNMNPRWDRSFVYVISIISQ